MFLLLWILSSPHEYTASPMIASHSFSSRLQHLSREIHNCGKHAPNLTDRRDQYHFPPRLHRALSTLTVLVIFRMLPTVSLKLQAVDATPCRILQTHCSNIVTVLAEGELVMHVLSPPETFLCPLPNLWTARQNSGCRVSSFSKTLCKLENIPPSQSKA